MPEEFTIYTNQSRRKLSLFRTWTVMARNIFDNRELIYQLFKRDFLMLYKKSFLGLGWHFIAPLLAIISWIFLNYTGILQPGKIEVPYPVYVLVGLTFWKYFSSFFMRAVESLKSGSAIILQVNFPHEILIVKQALQEGVLLIISFTITIIAIGLMGVIPKWQIIFVPLMIIPLFSLAGGIGIVFSVLSGSIGDVKKILELIMGLLMFATPIIYSLDKLSGIFRTIILLNPLTYLICEIRNVMLFGMINFLEEYVITSAFSVLVFLMALRLFYVSEEKVIEKIM